VLGIEDERGKFLRLRGLVFAGILSLFVPFYLSPNRI
jgi:hypothetical protein